MKTNHIFVVSALVISATFFSILAIFDLPDSVESWLISDIILGFILYINYLVMAMASGANKNRIGIYGDKKVIA